MLQYLHDIAQRNLLAQREGFKVDYCTGPDALQAVMDSYRDTANFILIDDTSTGSIHSNRVGWFEKRTHTIFVIAGWDMRKGDYEEKLQLCREVLRQLLTRMIADKARMVGGDLLTFLQLQNVYTQEFGRYSFNGATGCMAMLDNERPTLLTYDPTAFAEGELTSKQVDE